MLDADVKREEHREKDMPSLAQDFETAAAGKLGLCAALELGRCGRHGANGTREHRERQDSVTSPNELDQFERRKRLLLEGQQT